MFKFWIKKELHTLVMKEAKSRGVKPEYVLWESFDLENCIEYDGDIRVLTAKEFVKIPKSCLKGLSQYCVVKSYKRYWPKDVFEEIRHWPRVSDARFITRMKEAFPDAHPGLWHMREIRRNNVGDFLLTEKYGAFQFKMCFDERWNFNFNCEAIC